MSTCILIHPSTMTTEQELYDPIKSYLERQGYTVKAEVGACDAVGVRGTESPVVVELKTSFNLDLILQAVDRLKLSDTVYVAFPKPSGRLWQRRRRRILKLCRMLGIGILVVGPRNVTAVLDPAPYKPRPLPKHRRRLLKEFEERVGDPNTGGSTRVPIVTAYRQDALRILHSLRTEPKKVKDIRNATKIERTGPILQQNHYGWFERTSRGVYCISPKGMVALETFSNALHALTDDLAIS